MNYPHPPCYPKADGEPAERRNEALEKAESFFKPYKDSANDFVFPASLLDELDDKSRECIERKIIDRCNDGDTRFFDAVERVKTLEVRKAIRPDVISRHGDDYSCRSRLLEAMFINTRDTEILLFLLKMASCSEIAFHHLASAVERTDWTDFDTGTETHQLFLRTLMTITTVKRVIWRRSGDYEKIARSNLRQGRFKLLSLQDIEYFNKKDPWSDCAGRDPLTFFRSLEKRERYLNTGDIEMILSLLRDAVYSPEAYDVFAYMQKRKEIDQRVLMRITVQAAPSGRFADDDGMSHDPDFYRTLTKNK